LLQLLELCGGQQSVSSLTTGECQPSQESIIRSPKISGLKLCGLHAEIFLSPKGYREGDLANRGRCCTGDYAMEGSPTGAQRDLDNPIWLKVIWNRIFKELPPSTRIRLSLTSLMMGQTMRGYRPNFGTKFGWSLWSKMMGTSGHLRYSGVMGETAMTSQAEFLLPP
jgi:hypothetical protein